MPGTRTEFINQDNQASLTEWVADRFAGSGSTPLKPIDSSNLMPAGLAPSSTKGWGPTHPSGLTFLANTRLALGPLAAGQPACAWQHVNAILNCGLAEHEGLIRRGLAVGPPDRPSGPKQPSGSSAVSGTQHGATCDDLNDGRNLPVHGLPSVLQAGCTQQQHLHMGLGGVQRADRQSAEPYMGERHAAPSEYNARQEPWQQQQHRPGQLAAQEAAADCNQAAVGQQQQQQPDSSREVSSEAVKAADHAAARRPDGQQRQQQQPDSSWEESSEAAMAPDEAAAATADKQQQQKQNPGQAGQAEGAPLATGKPDEQHQQELAEWVHKHGGCETECCSRGEVSAWPAYLHLPVKSSKLDRQGLARALPAALRFAADHLSHGRRVLIHDDDGASPDAPFFLCGSLRPD